MTSEDQESSNPFALERGEHAMEILLVKETNRVIGELNVYYYILDCLEEKRLKRNLDATYSICTDATDH